MKLKLLIIFGSFFVALSSFIYVAVPVVNAQSVEGEESVFGVINKSGEFVKVVEKNVAEYGDSDFEDVEFHPMQIKVLREREYPGSEIKISYELLPHTNYRRYVAWYTSQGLIIYGLLTIPTFEQPAEGWPAILILHGYIEPEKYDTVGHYSEEQEYFAAEKFVTFKPDYRGHGNSGGTEEGVYFSPGYTTDALNAAASLQKMDYVNPDNIGVWAHSMGGNILVRSMVVEDTIHAGVVWGGVVSSYPDIFMNWEKDWNDLQYLGRLDDDNYVSDGVIKKRGTFKDKEKYWDSLSATSYLEDISGPLQIHHGDADKEVPIEFSEHLAKYLDQADAEYEFFVYAGGDHNLDEPEGAKEQALKRSLEFLARELR